MTIYDILKRAIETGIENDFRPREEVLGYFWSEKVAGGSGREFINPYPDSGVVWAENLQKSVQTMIVGLDIGQAEVVAIREWERREWQSADLFLSHHPRGRLLASFSHIFKTQLGNLASQGVDVLPLAKFFERRRSKMEEETLEVNIYRALSAVMFLKYSYIAVHTPADNIAARFVERQIKGSGAETLEDCIATLLEIPEYRLLEKESGLKPMVIAGKPANKLGKFLLTEFTGGEEGPLEVYKAMKNSGVDTLVVMHLSGAALAEARKRKLNVVAAGHMASDSIGLNFICDWLEKEGVKIVPLAGFIRHSRN